MAVHAARDGMDCRKCAAAERRDMGCTAPSPAGAVWEIKRHGIKSDRCPLRIVTAQSLEYLRARAWVQRGWMPNGGGWMDQSGKLLAAMEIIDAEINEIDAEAKK